MERHTIQYTDLSNAELPYQLAPQCKPGDDIAIHLASGETVVLDAHRALVDFILLHPYISAGLQIRPEDFFELSVVSDSVVVEHLTTIYERLLDERPDVPHMDLVSLVWEIINRLSRFAQECTSEYQQTIDILGLLKIAEHPKVKPIVTVELPPDVDSHDVEKFYADRAQQLMQVIQDPNALEDNVLLHFARSKHINPTKFPQNLILYGTRSMIDGTIPRYVVKESALSGLVTPADLANEALAALRSMYFSKETIKSTQYNARRLRMCTSYIGRIYPGDCGNHVGLSYVIPRRGAVNFLGNAYWDGPVKKWITLQNLPELIGTKVTLVSPTTCRHVDGFCESCAGWGRGRAIKYFPNGLNIGIYAATQVASVISQLILSAKHLSKTSSIVYSLPDGAQQWLLVGPGKLFLQPGRHPDVAKMHVRIPLNMLNVLSDIDLHVAEEAESFSQIEYFQIGYDANPETESTVQVSTDTCLPYLSGEFLMHMRAVRRHWQVNDDYLIVPMKGWDARMPILMYTQISADMLAFSSAVTAFFNRRLIDYTSISVALTDLCNLLYTKADVNVFYLQVMLKAFLKSPNDFRIPQITDPETVQFHTMERLIPARSSVMVLGYEKVENYLAQPASYLYEKGRSVFDPFFGEIDSDNEESPDTTDTDDEEADE